jgi:hypothetical protein
MSNDKQNDKTDPKQSQPRPGDPKRPTATLDLEAKEIERRDLPGTAAKPAEATPKAPETKSAPSGSVPSSGTKSASPEAQAGAKPDAKAKPAQSPATPARPEARRSGGFLSHMAAAAVGGILTLFGADVASRQLGLQLPVAGGGAKVDELASRIGSLERGLAEQASDKAESVLREQIEAVSGQVAALKSASGRIGALEGADAELKSAVDALKASLAALPEAGAKLPEQVEKRLAGLEADLRTIGDLAKDGGGGRVAQLADLAGRINDFELQLDSRLESLRKSVAQDLERQGAAITQRIAENVSSGEESKLSLATLKEGASRLGQDVETLKLEASRLNEKLEAGKASAEEVRRAVEATRNRTDEVEAALSDLKGGLDSRIGALVKSEQIAALLGPLQTEIAGLKTTLGSIAEREKSREEGAGRILLSLELANLKRAIDRGGSYANELAAVKRLAPEGLPLTPLDAAAATGLPTPQALEASFAPAARAMLDASLAPSGDASFMDALLSGARSVVRVRKTGDVEGADAEAVVARMETRLKSGDLEGVLTEAAGLAGASRAAAEPWLQSVSARLAVDRSIAGIEAELKKLMAGSGN